MKKLLFLSTIMILLCACAEVSPISPTEIVPTTTPEMVAALGSQQPVATQPVSFEVSWKTYQNDEIGISFEYPAVYDESQYESCRVTITSQPDGMEISMGHQSFLLIQQPQDSLAIQSYVENLITKKQWVLEEQEETSVGGEKAIRVEYRFGGSGGRYGTATVTSYNGQIFAFNFYAGTFCDAPEANVGEGFAYQHWLESFMFTK